jgi:glycine cleavage system aminomethyltransferase T
LRVSFIGELDLELHFPIEYANGLFERCSPPVPISDRHGKQRAMESRLEKSYRMWGSDLTPDYTPFEAGLDRFVRMARRFRRHKAALARRSTRGAEPLRHARSARRRRRRSLGNEPLF